MEWRSDEIARGDGKGEERKNGKHNYAFSGGMTEGSTDEMKPRDFVAGMPEVFHPPPDSPSCSSSAAALLLLRHSLVDSPAASAGPSSPCTMPSPPTSQSTNFFWSKFPLLPKRKKTLLLSVLLLLAMCGGAILSSYTTTFSSRSPKHLLLTALRRGEKITSSPVLRKRTREEKALSLFRQQAHDLGLNAMEEAVHILLLKAFDEFAEQRNLTYTLYGGTLIGVHRNGTLTPWDDDLDLLANSSHAEDILSSFHQMDHFDAFRHSRHLLKVFSTTFALARYSKYKWTWPWLDVFLFSEDNQTNIVSGNDKKVYARSDFLPTRRVDFLSLRLPVPSNTRSVLRSCYREDVRRVCKPNTYNHRREEYLKEASNVAIDCRALKEIFNFPYL